MRKGLFIVFCVCLLLAAAVGAVEILHGTKKSEAETASIRVEINQYVKTLQNGSSYTFGAKTNGDVDQIIWSVSDTTVGSINRKTGEFTARGTGTITITAKVGIKKSSINVVVTG